MTDITATQPTRNLSDLRKVLPINRVEFRIQSIGKTGSARILAYKDARVDMDRLDEVLGVGFWQRKHEIIDGNLYCSVGIWNYELAQWVWVQDVGTESQTESEKGQASDSFKRACFNLGIGRELYSYPIIQLKLKENEFEPYTYTDKGREVTKYRQTWNLKLRQWHWEIAWGADESGRPEVTSLIGYDEKWEIRYNHSRDKQQKTSTTSKNKAEKADTNHDNQEEFAEPTRQKSKAPADNKSTGAPLPWYNDFDKHRDYYYDKVADGELTPDEIIEDLLTRHRVAKPVQDKIRALGK